MITLVQRFLGLWGDLFLQTTPAQQIYLQEGFTLFAQWSIDAPPEAIQAEIESSKMIKKISKLLGVSQDKVGSTLHGIFNQAIKAYPRPDAQPRLMTKTETKRVLPSWMEADKYLPE